MNNDSAHNEPIEKGDTPFKDAFIDACCLFRQNRMPLLFGFTAGILAAYVFGQLISAPTLQCSPNSVGAINKDNTVCIYPFVVSLPDSFDSPKVNKAFDQRYGDRNQFGAKSHLEIVGTNEKASISIELEKTR
jgi:hypothetical protein